MTKRTYQYTFTFPLLSTSTHLYIYQSISWSSYFMTLNITSSARQYEGQARRCYSVTSTVHCIFFLGSHYRWHGTNYCLVWCLHTVTILSRSALSIVHGDRRARARRQLSSIFMPWWRRSESGHSQGHRWRWCQAAPALIMSCYDTTNKARPLHAPSILNN